MDIYTDSLFYKVFMGCVLSFYFCVLVWIGWTMFIEEYKKK